MRNQDLAAAVGRAGKRASLHLLQALIEGVKAVEAVLDEMGKVGENEAEAGPAGERIDIE